MGYLDACAPPNEEARILAEFHASRAVDSGIDRTKGRLILVCISNRLQTDETLFIVPGLLSPSF